MTPTKKQCHNCGYFYSGDPWYFSEDLATYWSPSPIFAINWCFHCSKVTIYKQARFLGIFPVQFVKPSAVMSLEEFVGSPLGNKPDYASGRVATHVLRLIWHCLLQHQPPSDKPEDQYPTFQLALEKLTPIPIAYMLSVLIHYTHFADLPRQIQEGIYLKELYHQYLIFEWLEKSKTHSKTPRVRSLFETALTMK
jgi:hypothetical protein